VSRLTLVQGVEAFLGLSFGDREKPYRTQRDARDEAMRMVGFAQAQEQLRNILAQVKGAGRSDAHMLAEVRSDRQLKPMDGPGNMKLWVPPELPVKRR
jgi:hypothetical protein